MTSSLPPRRRDSRDWVDLSLHTKTNLKQLAPGFMSGRFPPARPLGRLSSDDVEEDDPTDDLILFLNTDHAVCSGPGANIVIPLTHTPEVGSEQVFYNGMGLKRTDWHRTDTQLTVPGEPWFRAGRTAWVDYAYYDEEIETEPATFISVSSVVTDHTSIPLPSDQVEGDLLVMALSATNQVGCSDSRFSLKNSGTRPTWTGPLMQVWVGVDDGNPAPVSVLMDSVAGSGGADSCGGIMRIRGAPLLPATSESAVSGSATPFAPSMPALGSYGVIGIASEVGLVSSTISDDQLSHWTTRLRINGNGGGHTSIYLGTAVGGVPTGSWAQAGSDPYFFGWVGGLQ